MVINYVSLDGRSFVVENINTYFYDILTVETYRSSNSNVNRMGQYLSQMTVFHNYSFTFIPPNSLSLAGINISLFRRTKVQ